MSRYGPICLPATNLMLAGIQQSIMGSQNIIFMVYKLRSNAVCIWTSCEIERGPGLAQLDPPDASPYKYHDLNRFLHLNSANLNSC